MKYKNVTNVISATFPNLKAGRGDACAGQVSAIVVLAFLTNVNDLDSSENFGLVPPTGSIK